MIDRDSDRLTWSSVSSGTVIMPFCMAACSIEVPGTPSATISQASYVPAMNSRVR